MPSSSSLFASAALAAALVAAAPAAAQSFHFENGDLSGWLQGGTAFRHQPTFGNNVAPRRPGESPGQDGDWWIGSFEDRNGPAQPLGQVQGDEPQGTLISPLFTIRDNNISLLVGGGEDRDNLRVDLVVEMGPGESIDSDGSHLGSPVSVPEGQFIVRRSATGANEERMRRVQWDTRSLIGRRARLMIVDNSSAPWGHINVDDVRPGNAIVAGDPPLATVVGSPPRAVVVAPPRSPVAVPLGPPVAYPVAPPIIATPVPARPAMAVPVGPAVAYPVGGGPVIVAAPAPPPPSGKQVKPPAELEVPEGMVTPPRLGQAGHFRVVVTGFRVNHQTNDDALQRDGVGDEIFIRGDTFFLTESRLRFTTSTAFSALYGQPGIQAGSAGPPFGSASEDRGGLLTGDTVPRRDLFSSTPPRLANALPLVLFDGLIDRSKEILIIPTIWEWDGAFDGPTKDAYDQELRSKAIFNIRALPVPLTSYSDEHGLPLVENLASPLNVFDEGTRPIGAATRGSSRFGSMSLPAIVLNLDTALRAAGKQFEDHTPLPIPAGGVIPPAMPLPRGVIPIQFSDVDGRPGYYTLYVRIEHLID